MGLNMSNGLGYAIQRVDTMQFIEPGWLWADRPKIYRKKTEAIHNARTHTMGLRRLEEPTHARVVTLTIEVCEVVWEAD